MSERRCLACSSVIWPAFRSASIAICLPGMASRVKRAATSATRPAPFVTTTNWMTIRIRKITRPTITLPPTTKAPNEVTRLPASPCSSTRRVTDTLIASRNSVVSSSSDGNELSSSAFCMYSVDTRIASAPAMFSVMNRSINIGGSGMINMQTTSTTAPAPSRSVCLTIFLMISLFMGP